MGVTLAQGMQKILGNVQRGIDTMPDMDGSGRKGGWEIVSHTLSEIGDWVVITFVLRRELQAGGRNGR